MSNLTLPIIIILSTIIIICIHIFFISERIFKLEVGQERLIEINTNIEIIFLNQMKLFSKCKDTK